MSEHEKFFVVVDPTLDQHVALDRAIITAKLMDIEPQLCIFVAVDVASDEANDRDAEFTRNSCWFDSNVHEPLRAAGLEYQIEISWATHWQKAVMSAAQKYSATRILVPAGKPKKSRRMIFSESKWKLLKRAFCPVILVREGASPQRKTVLAAVNFQVTHGLQKTLNKNIISRGERLAKSYGADFHVVNAYIDSMLYPDRGMLARATGLSSSHIHVVQGHTDEGIAQVAQALSADVVVVGTLGQTGQVRNLRGNTVERVISALDVDVVVVNSEYQ